MLEVFSGVVPVPQPGDLAHNIWILFVAAVLGAALGVVRPVRSEIIPRSAHVIQAQILLAIGMNTATAGATPNTPVILEPVSVLRWIFIRKGQMLTCEISVNGSQSYDVCVVPHWDVASSVVESYDRPAAAMQRHAELAWYFRAAGWVRACETTVGHMAAA